MRIFVQENSRLILGWMALAWAFLGAAAIIFWLPLMQLFLIVYVGVGALFIVAQNLPGVQATAARRLRGRPTTSMMVGWLGLALAVGSGAVLWCLRHRSEVRAHVHVYLYGYLALLLGILLAYTALSLNEWRRKTKPGKH